MGATRSRKVPPTPARVARVLELKRKREAELVAELAEVRKSIAVLESVQQRFIEE